MPDARNLEVVRSAVLCLHNAERARHGLPRLRENSRLRGAASRHSARMVGSHFFDHTTPAGLDDGRAHPRHGLYERRSRLVDRREHRLGPRAASRPPRRSIARWMNSPGHRANILQRSFREIGIGISAGVPVHLSASQSGATYTTDFGFRR